MLATQSITFSGLNSFAKVTKNYPFKENIIPKATLLLSSHEESLLGLIDWLETTGFVTVVSHSQKELANPVILKFRLAEKYENNFVWVRGFMSLGNPFKIVVDREFHTFSLTLNSKEIKNFKTYLGKIFNTLKNELQFRDELRQLLKLETKYIQLQNKIRNNSKAFI